MGSDCAEGPLDLGRSHLEDGTRVSAETSRRLSCDAAVVRVVRGEAGEGGATGANGHGTGARDARDVLDVLDVGRRTRTVPAALRRALEVRDRGCRFPGCGLRFTDGHHIRHWADGGETKLDNLILLCRYHHRLVHEGGWRVELWGRGTERRPAFIDPRGGIHMDVERASGRRPGRQVKGAKRPVETAKRPVEGTKRPEETAKRPEETAKRPVKVAEQPVKGAERPVEALVRENRARGIEPDGWSLAPRLPSPPPGRAARGWRPREARWEIEDRALDALDEAHFGG